MQLTLTQRRALVTGASQGLGLAMSLRFAEAGADLALVARRADVLEHAREQVMARARGGARVVAIAGDVSTAEGCAAIAAAADEALGGVDVLVNNAGSSCTGPFESHDDEVWQQDIDLKLFAAVRLCRAFMPGMRERRWGRVINVLNTFAKAPAAGTAPTSVTRAAGMALTKALSAEYAQHNVLVNALLVGLIESDQWVRRAAREGRSLESLQTELARRIPLGRIGTAEEFANMACLLASDQGGYITGTAINVDGGMCAVV
ncbi:MAG: SDR family oxidoreductase [Burkholderiaceae bacterium]